MKSSRKLFEAAKVLALFAAPILWATASHALLTALWPGQVEVSTWRVTSTIATFVCAVLTTAMLWRSQAGGIAKVVLSPLVIGFFGLVAVSLNMRSTCVAGPTFVGEMSRSMEIASCE